MAWKMVCVCEQCKKESTTPTFAAGFPSIAQTAPNGWIKFDPNRRYCESCGQQTPFITSQIPKEYHFCSQECFDEWLKARETLGGLIAK